MTECIRLSCKRHECAYIVVRKFVMVAAHTPGRRGIADFVISVKMNGPVVMEFGFGEDYLVIEVSKRKRRWFYVDGEFYVREGNRSRKPSPQETAEYQEEHG